MIGNGALRAISALLLTMLAATNAVADRLKDGRIAIVDISESLLDVVGKPDDEVFEQLRNSGGSARPRRAVKQESGLAC